MSKFYSGSGTDSRRSNRKCAGLYRSAAKTLYVTERFAPVTYVPQLNMHLRHTLFHEFGHAVDHCKQISRSETFVAAYQSDCRHLTNGLREHFHYYTQAEEAGPSELFAELFADAVSAQGDVDTNGKNLIKTCR
jgi:hypothetical protein